MFLILAYTTYYFIIFILFYKIMLDILKSTNDIVYYVFKSIEGFKIHIFINLNQPQYILK